MRFLLQYSCVHLVRLQSGALAVFSPTALTPEVRSTVKSMGDKVAYIAALDYEHHIFITQWAVAFPNAKLLGVEGLAEKREKDKSTAGSFQFVWTQKNKASIKVDPEFDTDFDYEYVGSHANKELVFLYKPERTLIEAEYVIHRSRLPFWIKFRIMKIVLSGYLWGRVSALTILAEIGNTDFGFTT